MEGHGQGGIEGLVRDALGRPLGGAVVSIIGDSPPHRDIAARTGLDGRFRLPGLLPGHYTLKAVTATGAEACTSTEVADGDVATVALEPAPAAHPKPEPEAATNRAGRYADG